VEETLEELLAGFGHDRAEHGAAPDRDEKEQTPPHRAEIGDEAMDRWYLVERLLRHECVHLKRQVGSGRLARRQERAVEATWDAAKAVVAPRIRAVETQRNRFHTCRLQASDLLGGQERRAARRHRDRKPERPRGLDEREEIDALQRISAGQHEMREGIPEARQ